MDVDRLLLAATYVVVGLLGAALGIWGAFLIPLRLFGHVEGLADVVGIAGPAVVGLLAAIGTRHAPAAVTPGIGWVVAVIVLASFGPGGDVIVPGKLGPDPGVVIVGTVYFFSGLLGTLLAGVLAGRRLRAAAAR